MNCSNFDILFYRLNALQRRIDELSYEVDKILLILSRFDEEVGGKK